MTRTKLPGLALGLLALAALGTAPAAAAWPERSISIIVGFAPGGATDVLARIVADPMGKTLGQTIIVENRAGADGSIGAGQVARAEPDGYTLLMVPSSITVNPSLYDNLTYDPLKSFRPVGLIADTPAVVAVRSQSPIKTFLDLVAASKKEPLLYGSTASSTFLATELLKKITGIQGTQVPYKGGGPAVQALMSGDVHFMFTGTSNILPHIQNGRLRALAVTGTERSALLPDVPTLVELGPPDWIRANVNNWYGLVAPVNTPDDIVKKLNDTLRAALDQPAVQERFKALVVQGRPGDPQSFGKLMSDEVARWNDLVKEIGKPKQ